MKARAGLWLLMVPLCASCRTSPKRPAASDELEGRRLDLSLTNQVGDVFVDFHSRAADYPKLAVLPLKSAVELAGASLSDLFTTELLKTARYELIERGQMESLLKEQELQLNGVTDDSAAIQIGKVLGVRGVVVGSVSEYGYEKVRFSKAPSIGLNVRMIDTTTGKIVWSVSHSAIAKGPASMTQHAAAMVAEMMAALGRAWIDADDRMASGLPPPQLIGAAAGVRQAALEWKEHMSALIAGYEVARRGPGDQAFLPVVRLRKMGGDSITYVDKKLADLTGYAYEIRTVSRYGLVSAQAASADVATVGPPQAPQGAWAESGRIRQVPVTWKPSADPNVAGYVVLREEAGGFTDAGRVEGREIHVFVDKGASGKPLADQSTYSYRVVAFNTADVRSEPSAAVKATTKAAPVKVAGLSAGSGVARSVPLTWSANPAQDEIGGYVVYRSEQPGGPLTEIGTTQGDGDLRFVDEGNRSHEVKDGATYFYRVAARNVGNVEGPPSECVRAITKPVPTAVKGLKATTGGIGKVTLTWKANPEPDIVSYVAYRSVTPAGRFSRALAVPAPATRAIDENLGDGSTWTYRVQAVDKDGLEGELSEVEGGTKSAPTPPRSVQCAPLSGAVAITWTPSDTADVTAYRVYMDDSLLRGQRRVAEVDGVKHVQESLKSGKVCKFSVSAVDKDGLESRRAGPVKGAAQ